MLINPSSPFMYAKKSLLQFWCWSGPTTAICGSNLIHNFMQELSDGGEANQGNFGQSAKVQEIINAAALSHREKRWVNLPLA